MRRTTLAAAMLALAIANADAQARKPPAKGGPVVRYAELYSGILGDLPAEGFLRETRSGGSVTAAELDVCFSVAENSTRKDRFVVALTPNGGRLTGSTQTQDDKQPVTVALTRELTGESLSLSGTIRLGGRDYPVTADDNTVITEEQYRENRSEETELTADPPDFTTLSPGVINLRVERGALASVVKALRAAKVSVAVDSLLASCADIRAGHQTVRIDVNPDKAAGLLASLKGVQGVTDAGWGSGYPMDDAVRLSAAPWREGSTLDRKKFAAAASASIGKTLGASVQSTEWDEQNGELTVKLKRPNTALRGLELTDLVEVTLFPGPEKPKANDGFIVWVARAEVEVTDEGAEPRMKLLVPAAEEDSQSVVTIEVAPLAAALAQDLGGQTWDSERSAWRR